MGKPRNISRIYLAYRGVNYAFYWVSAGSDQSVYFGSSIADKFEWGFSENVNVPAKGTRIAPDAGGRKVSSRELVAKYSLHTSGVALLPTRSNHKRDEYQIRNLESYPEYMPLVGVLPMPMHRYRKSEKMIRPSDIVLNLDEFNGFPFAVLLYVHPVDGQVPNVVQGLLEQYPRFLQESAAINDKLQISAVAYSDEGRFTYWRYDEYVITARPDPATLEFTWPVFMAT